MAKKEEITKEVVARRLRDRYYLINVSVQTNYPFNKEANSLLERDLERINHDLSDVNLSEANLMSANLSDVNLKKANLSSAWLQGAILENANLSGANIDKANFSSANLHEAKFENCKGKPAVLYLPGRQERGKPKPRKRSRKPTRPKQQPLKSRRAMK